MMYQSSCTSIVFWPFLSICPFLYRHIECEYLDGEVPFNMLKKFTVFQHALSRETHVIFINHYTSQISYIFETLFY